MGRKHHDLLVWRQSIELVKLVYVVTATFPADERFGLVSQMRRAAVSVPSNIAEGAARETKKEFHYFLTVARGSLSELDTQLIIAKELGYMESEHEIEAKVERVFALLGGLKKSMRDEDK